MFSEQQPHVESKKLLKNLMSVKSLPSLERYYCSQCGVLLGKKGLSLHVGHGVTQGVSDSQLEEPTTLLCPVDDSKSQAVSCYEASLIPTITPPPPPPPMYYVYVVVIF